MASFTLISGDDRTAWEAALDEVPHAFGHRWTNASIDARRWGGSAWLMVYRSRLGVVVSALIERRFHEHADIVSAAGFAGFTGDGISTEFADDWFSYARSRGWVCGFIQINPLLVDAGSLPFPRWEHQKDIFVIDLREGPETLLRGFSTSRRRLIRRWENDPGRVVEDRDSIMEFGKKELSGFMKDRSATDPVLDLHAWDTLMHADEIRMLGIEEQGELSAIAVDGRAGDIVDGLYLLSRQGRTELSTLLVWEAIKRHRDAGATSFNLGGGVEAGDGVEQAKRLIGGKPFALPALKQIYDGPVYSELCSHLPADGTRTKYFPAYRARDRLVGRGNDDLHSQARKHA